MNVDEVRKWTSGGKEHAQTFKITVCPGVVAESITEAISKAVAMFADKNPFVWAATHQHQIDCE